MALMASTISPIRRAGRDHCSLKRRSMWGRICEPSPNPKRPSVNSCRSLAVSASTMGLRAKPMATAVLSRSVEVAAAADASGRKGSWRDS